MTNCKQFNIRMRCSSDMLSVSAAVDLLARLRKIRSTLGIETTV